MIKEVFTSREAAKIYGLSPNTVTQWCNRGRFQEDEYRQSEKVWLVTRQGMNRLTKKRGLDMTGLLWMLSMKSVRMMMDKNDNLLEDYEERLAILKEQVTKELPEEEAIKLLNLVNYSIKIYKKTGAWDFVRGYE